VNLCEALSVHRSGFYAWLKKPKSRREQEDEYLLGFIKQFWLESGCVYGYRKIHKDMRAAGERCGRNRVRRLMREAGLVSQRKASVIVHSDQGCQYTSYDWISMLEANNMTPSMSRRGNCHDNACAESFFALLKRERIRRKVYPTREAGQNDIFNYIEMFYNPIRRHGNNNDLSPAEYEKNYFMKQTSV